MTIIGIDVGATGAIAIVGRNYAAVYDIETIDGRIDFFSAQKIICAGLNMLDAVVYVEKLHATPDGSKANFSKGMSYATVLCAIRNCNIRYVEVLPQAWKKAMKIKADKEHARAEAIRIFPDLYQDLKRKKDHNRAEALLIAEYGRRQEVLLNVNNQLATTPAI